jgi:uncharacterized protein YjbJ (UPF0337 family)
MTWDHIEGRCKQYSGCLMEKWGRLIHDDAVIIRGKRDQLFGILQERYGVSKKDAEAQVNEFSVSLWSASCEQEPHVSSSHREQAGGSGQR